jgi:glucose/arabinose dehydrogenase
MKIAYATGQRVIMGTPDSVVDLSVANNDYVSSVHWPKTLDISDDGTIYVGNGGDQSEACNASTFPGAFAQLFQGGGGVFKIDGTPGGNPVAAGFRNPIAVRCQKGHNLCFATELALDGSAASGGREKLIPIRQGDDWGFPCCATANVAYGEVTMSGGNPNCASVAAEPVSFVIGDTPFGLDFETGVWPAPYTNNIVVTLHGAVGSWIGARVVSIPTQANGMPTPSSDLGSSTFMNLATGWDDGLLDHGRPAAISFSADGRAFIANDIDGDIFWIAPISLKTKS